MQVRQETIPARIAAGKPANAVMRVDSAVVKIVDGAGTTDDNFTGKMPEMTEAAGFDHMQVTRSRAKFFGNTRTLPGLEEPGY